MAPAAAVYALASLSAFAAFVVDKWAARRSRRRVPEGMLHLLELVGGWPGALVAMRVLRHKSSKPRYYLVSWGIAALHGAVWLVWFMFV